jgi:hypothetical protein
MKKITSFLTAIVVLAFTTAASAVIQSAASPQEIYNGKDYVGKIVATSYKVDADNGQQILIMTKADKMNESSLSGLTISITDKDLPYGMTLANAIGKKSLLYSKMLIMKLDMLN